MYGRGTGELRVGRGQTTFFAARISIAAHALSHSSAMTLANTSENSYDAAGRSINRSRRGR
jgi:hypothetical protein